MHYVLAVGLWAGALLFLVAAVGGAVQLGTARRRVTLADVAIVLVSLVLAVIAWATGVWAWEG